MDVTRDSSQRPDTLSEPLPPVLTDPARAGASPMPKLTKPPGGAPAGPAAPRPAPDEGPDTEPLALRFRGADGLPGPAAPAPAARPASFDGSLGGAGAPPASTTRRPPRVDPALRESAAVTLPGWIALLALLAGVAAVLLVLARTGALPHWDALPDVRSAAVKQRGGAEVTTTRALAAVAASSLLAILALAGLLANAGGETRVLTRWGRYRGTVRRAGLVWVNPLLHRHRVDVRLRHWRSEPVHVVDRAGTPIVVRLLIVWRVKDTARALLSVADHENYLREQVHAVVTRTASTLPCDSNAVPGPALRDGHWFADEMTRSLAAEAAPAGLEVYSVQPLSLEYAPEVAESMRRRRLAELDAGLRTVLVDDAVEAAALAVRRLERATAHELDEAARSALMKQLLVAFVAPAGVAASVPSPSLRAGGSPSPARAGGRKPTHLGRP
ncbi:SPFH domain-containing protein [Kitasatospora sp. NPDC050543]|uniref:SPFH domain-containing protein n=1 Tax=Kitasatospora sp. NPDC050543 TaxID=3364054 RepID=UPI00379B9FA9